MNFTPTAYKSSAPQNLHNLLSSSLYNSSSLLNQDYSGTSPSLSTPETSTPSPLLDTFGLSQDPFLDTNQNNLNQPQPLVGSSSWNRHGVQPLTSMQNVSLFYSYVLLLIVMFSEMDIFTRRTKFKAF